MPFETTVESLDAVPEDARPFYRKAADGKFNLITAQDVDKLDGALARTRQERDTFKTTAAEAAAWKEAGLTIEEIKALKDEKAAREQADAEKKGEWDRLRKQMEDNHNKETEKLNGKVGQYRSALEKRLIDAEATAEIANAKGVPQLLLPHIRGRVKVEEVDGDFKVTVLTPDGKGPQLNKDNNPMTIKELVASMRADEVYGRAFEGSGHSGGDGTGGSGGKDEGPGNTGGLRKSTMTTKQKADFMAEHGAPAYSKLPL